MSQLFLYLRFSSKRQRDGNSIRRQIEYGIRYCEKKSIPFDPESQTYSDLGTSGFRGKHRRGDRSGGLGEFLGECRAGRIPPGSYLLVESFDRLTREHPLDAMELLRQILREYGVHLVVMRPEMELTSATLGELQGIIAFIEAMRAHGESAAKSDRSRYNWTVKRELAGQGRIISARIPSWLTLADGRAVEIPAKVAAVRRAFELSRKGHGVTLIARRLNQEGFPPLTARSSQWEPALVRFVLRSRTVLGEWQPRVIEGGKLVRFGSPVVGYYPAIISQDEWDAVQMAMASRRRRAGRASITAVNLFTGLVHFGGSRAVYRSKDGVPYLDPADESHVGIRLDQLERCILFWIAEVKLSLDNTSGLSVLRDKEASLAAAVADLEAQIDADPGLVSMVPTVRKWRAELDGVQKKIEAESVPIQTSFSRSQSLIDRMRDADQESRVEMRRELRQTIRYVITRIDVTVDGSAYRDKLITVLITMRDGTRRAAWYRVREGLVTAGGLCRDSVGDLVSAARAIATGIFEDGVLAAGEGTRRMTFPVDVQPFRRRGKSLEKFPRLDTSVDQMRVRIRELSAAGLSAPKIAAEMGISRWTVYRYLKD